MKAMLIDPHKREVTEINWDGSHDSLTNLIGAEFLDFARLDNGDLIAVNDIGFKDPNAYFFHLNYYNWLAGKAVLIGSSDAGENADCKDSLAQTRPKVIFSGPHGVPAEA